MVSGNAAHGTHRRGTWLLWAVVILALLVLPAAAAVVWSLGQAPTYAAQVDLLHEPEDATASDLIDRQLATHQVLLLRPDGLDEAARSIGRDPDDLADGISAEVVQGSSVLRIEVVDEDRERALAAATTVAERYVDVADRLAPASDIGRMDIVAPPTVLPDPVGPQPLRAAAAGALLGAVLVAALLALLRLRNGSGGRFGQ